MAASSANDEMVKCMRHLEATVISQKILVLAATGNVGMPLVDRLLDIVLAVNAASRDGCAVGGVWCSTTPICKSIRRA